MVGDVIREVAGMFGVAAAPIAFKDRRPIKHRAAMVSPSTGFCDCRTARFPFDQDAYIECAGSFRTKVRWREGFGPLSVSREDCR